MVALKARQKAVPMAGEKGKPMAGPRAVCLVEKKAGETVALMDSCWAEHSVAHSVAHWAGAKAWKMAAPMVPHSVGLKVDTKALKRVDLTVASMAPYWAAH